MVYAARALVAAAKKRVGACTSVYLASCGGSFIMSSKRPIIAPVLLNELRGLGLCSRAPAEGDLKMTWPVGLFATAGLVVAGAGAGAAAVAAASAAGCAASAGSGVAAGGPASVAVIGEARLELSGALARAERHRMRR